MGRGVPSPRTFPSRFPHRVSAASYRSVLKRLWSDRRFTLLSLLTLSLGIGLTVAIASLVNGVLLTPLPYPDPERLVDVCHRMVLGDGLKTAVPGVALGVLGAFAVTRFMSSLLFSVSPLDPVSFFAAPLLLLLVALGSSLLPAERASRVNPIEALRRE